MRFRVRVSVVYAYQGAGKHPCEANKLKCVVDNIMWIFALIWYLKTFGVSTLPEILYLGNVFYHGLSDNAGHPTFRIPASYFNTTS